MKFLRHDDIKRDLCALKKYKDSNESLESWELLLLQKGIKEMPTVKKCSGYGLHDIYKARVVPARENCGKSKGYRVLFEVKKEEIYIILFFSRHGIYKKEHDLINIVKNRIKSFDNNLTDSN